MQRKSATTVKASDAGTKVEDYLAGRFTYHTRQNWRDLINSKKVLLNGQPAKATTLLATGDTLEYLAAEDVEPKVDPHFDICFEDRDLMVIDKPGNLPCHPAGRYFNHTLWSLLQNKLNITRPFFINRIDRETSGIVLVAKTAAVARACCRQFETGGVRKRYLALVEGLFPKAPVHASGTLAPDPDSQIRKKRRLFFGPGDSAKPVSGKYCNTLLQREKKCNPLSLVAALPETGRCHQIRASLYSLGFPVVGDKIYGVDDTLFLRFISDTLTPIDKSRLRLERQALHAASIEMTHPRTGRPILFETPLAKDMKALLTLSLQKPDGFRAEASRVKLSSSTAIP
jgi:23S rRNA pseudouridine955/2504/2580 synthase/23S rRNA pseudouridine1911/1915/1917 synthase